jgi:peptide/nickel transport system permease protein
MLIYTVKRLLLLIPTLIAVLLLLFSLSYLLPGEPAEIILGPRATPEMAEDLNQKLGLDKPWYVSFYLYLKQIVSGDLGTSIFREVPVFQAVMGVLPYTLALTFTGMGFAVLVGITIGLTAANFENTIWDSILGIFSFICASTPTYVAAVLILLFFSIRLNLLPVMGAGEGGIFSSLHHLIGPAIALSVGWTGYIARLTRSSMLETINEDYITTSQSFGLPKSFIYYRYALKKAIKPIVAVVGLGIGRLLGGALFVEVIFTRPGLGRLTVDAIFERDLPIVRGGVLVAAFLFVIANLIADLSYAYLDPRIRNK